MSALIATPCYQGAMHVGFFRTCMAIADLGAQLGVEVDFLVTEGESHITRARNNLAATFLQTGFDTLVFIDADIEMEAADFFKLLDIPGVRGAAVPCKTKDHAEMLSLWVDGKRPKRSEMPAAPFSVDFLGSAVLAIDRSVLEALKSSEQVQPYDSEVGPAWDFFRDGVYQDTWLSEDFAFCALLTDNGIAITCDPSIRVKHFGADVWTG